MWVQLCSGAGAVDDQAVDGDAVRVKGGREIEGDFVAAQVKEWAAYWISKPGDEGDKVAGGGWTFVDRLEA